VSANHPAQIERNFEANISWFENKALDTNQVYLLQTHSNLTKIKIQEILYKYDVHTQEQLINESINLNDIGRVTIKAANDVVYDSQQNFPENSRAIIIDPRTNITVAAAIIQGS
ncbi:MAG: elongation factor 1-alpha C-terminal domain-related protein, partial [Sphingobacterium sp.]